MAILRIRYETGAPDQVLEFDPSQAPFQHDGQPGSILDIMLARGVPLEHACGGNCACTTCHVIVKSGMEHLSENTEEEDDLLDKAPGLTPTSRLGCQAVMSEGEVTILIPRHTINQQVG